jgi:GGDEF domain-containing protein
MAMRVGLQGLTLVLLLVALFFARGSRAARAVVHCPVSQGGTAYGLDAQREKLERAEQALLLAKTAGRNRVIAWDPTVTTGRRLQRPS